MESPVQTTSPSIPHILKTIRQRDSRSAQIHRQIAALGAPGEKGYESNVYRIVDQYCHHNNRGLAVLCFNLHRIPFNHLPHGRTLGRGEWVQAYWPSTLGIRENLQGFIELMDNANQLATAFAGVPDPERHWRVMCRRALHRFPFFNEAEDIEEERIQTQASMNAISLGFQVSANRNPPGSPPVDITGNPINSDFFALVQREFLMWEFKTRAYSIRYLYKSGYLPKNKQVQDLVRIGVGMPPQINIQPFKQLVKRQRLIITGQKATIDQDKEKLDFSFILNDGDFFALGVQGLAASLPKQGDQYEKGFLYLLNFVNYQLDIYMGNYGYGSREAWCDGWFGKYADAGPAAHISLDDDYLSADGEYPSWLELFVGKKRAPVTTAREFGLITAVERVLLWGPVADAFSCDVLWETFAWLDNWFPSARICNLWDTTMITPRSLLVETQ
ncbi:uncharacterized protein B0J16DRAFT_392277 [Fusarium flagelliforme]|uniref:Uncharacterized protein n=1 Tax=Fusarium flagelliforme TaxID=2675880 RepID=A0A395MPU6_9HYPO|nr:uncharacterized protein B0J16DRAFT_392277 [Fusarium flagelliforme]KAH7198512.1 hypothetical protein B0J16DRAFT_392277 [Fusarium flagelliforme]RFN49968.1 hypothetical protein FIE12Z_5766 [Fusarium flagelliforme]